MVSTCMTILFFFTANADDSTFFLKDIASVESWVNTFKVFSWFSGLKSQIADLGILKETQEAVYGIQNTDLMNDTIKMLGIHFSYNKKFKQKETI